MSDRRVEAELLQEVARILGEPVTDLDPARSLSELGLDSVGYASVSAFIQKRFGVAVRPETLFALPSVQSTAAHLATLLASAEPHSRRLPGIPVKPWQSTAPTGPPSAA